MRDHHHTTGERQNGLLQRAQGFNVQIVGGFVQQQHVGALLEGVGQVQTAALTTGEFAHTFLLVRTLEVEAAHIGARVHFVVADAQNVLATGDGFPDGLVILQVLPALFNVGHLHSLAQLDLAAVGLLGTGDHPEQGGLTGTVTTDNTDHGTFGNAHGQVVDQQAVAVALGDIFQFDHFVPQALARRNVDFVGLVAGLEFLALQLIEAGQAGFVLGLTALGVLTYPFQFRLHGLLMRGFRLGFLLQALLFGLQPVTVVALIGNAVAAVQLQNPAGGIVQEVAVVGDGHHGTGELLQELLQPVDTLGVQVVGGLVQQQHVRAGQQQAAQGHPAAFTPGEFGYICIPGRQAQGVGGHFQLVVQVVGIPGGDDVFQLALTLGQRIEIRVRLGVGGVNLVQLSQGVHRLAHAVFHIAAYVFFRVQLRLLGQVAHGDTRHGPRLTVIVLVHPGHDPQQGGFTGAVQAQNTDFRAREEGQGDVFQDLFLGRHHLANPIHAIDVLRHGGYNLIETGNSLVTIKKRARYRKRGKSAISKKRGEGTVGLRPSA